MCIFMKVIPPLWRMGLSRLRMESEKVFRKKLDPCRREMERAGLQPEMGRRLIADQWREGQ